MGASRSVPSRTRFCLALLGCAALGFVLGLGLGLVGEPFRVVAPGHAAAGGRGGERGRGHAYGREIADLMDETKAKGQDKKAFLDELKRRGHRVNEKPDRTGVQANEKRMKENRAVAGQPVDSTLLRKTGQEALQQDKIKNSSPEAKSAVRRAHGLE